MTQCSAFGKCGGCLYQDMNFEQYIQKKENFIKNAFRDYGMEISLKPIISVPFGTRRRATFAFCKGIVGFNSLKSKQIVPLNQCPALTPELSAFLPVLQGLIRELKGSGDISVLSTPFGIDMHIKRDTGSATLPQRELLADFAQKNKTARILYNGEPIVQNVQLPFAPDSFLQPSVEGEKILVNLVTQSLANAKKGVDLFCGAGTFTRPLQQAGVSVMGYDIMSDSLNALGALGTERDLFRNPLLATELNGLDVVVIDPPRSGAQQQCRQLAQSNVPLIIMISCNPSTAARDIKELVNNGGYTLNTIIPVDQFIYTNHIEIFCLLSK